MTLGTLSAAGAVMTAGVDVVALTEWSLVLSTLALPLIYGPVWVAARDRRTMGEHASGRATDSAGAAFLGLAALVAVTAVPALALGR